MKKNLEKKLNRYYQEISKALPRKRKKEFLIDIKNGVNSYLADNPEATIDDVITFIGEPKDIADEYYANETGEEIIKGIRFGKKIVFGVISAIIFALIVYIITMIDIINNDNKIDNGYYIIEMSEITSNTDI